MSRRHPIIRLGLSGGWIALSAEDALSAPLLSGRRDTGDASSQNTNLASPDSASVARWSLIPNFQRFITVPIGTHSTTMPQLGMKALRETFRLSSLE